MEVGAGARSSFQGEVGRWSQALVGCAPGYLQLGSTGGEREAVGSWSWSLERLRGHDGPDCGGVGCQVRRVVVVSRFNGAVAGVAMSKSRRSLLSFR